MYEDRAKKGAELLDRVRPGWAGEIAADRLAMGTSDGCVLGQLYGGYGRGWFAVLAPLQGDETKRAAAYDYGFALRESDQDRWGVSADAIRSRFAALAEAWQAEIRARVGREAPSSKPEPAFVFFTKGNTMGKIRKTRHYARPVVLSP